MEDCIFCKINTGKEKSWKVFGNEHVYAFLDIHPTSKYHTLIIPKNHYENIFDVPEKELQEVMSVVKKLCDLYKEKLNITNIQIINSSGEEAQQDVFHLHFHIVPRNLGDGQDIKWNTHPEWTADYDNMVKQLNS